MLRMSEAFWITKMVKLMYFNFLLAAEEEKKRDEKNYDCCDMNNLTHTHTHTV